MSGSVRRDDVFVQAWDYVSDALGLDARRAFEQELNRSEPLRDEVRRLRGLAADMLAVQPEVQPTADLRDRLLSRLDSTGPLVSRQSAAEWQDSGVPGVEVRRLFVDRNNRRETVLIRMHAGAVYPIHGHAGHEECYVIDGDLLDGDVLLQRGDYTCFAEGSTHGPLSSEAGCLLLVQASIDEASPPPV